MSTPTVSVIIPNLDSPHIHHTLDALRAQQFDLATVEVLVVGRDAPGLVQNHMQTDALVQHIDPGHPTGAAYNRNLGMRRARGEIFCFTDADCVPAPNWLHELVQPLRRGEAQAVGGGVHFDPGNYWSICDNVSWFHQFLAHTPPGTRPHLPTLNLAVTRKLIDAVGPMDEAYPVAAGEDTEWTERMVARGYALHFAPQAIVTHCAQRTSLAALWRHGYNYGRYSSKVAPPAQQTPASARPLPAWLRHPRALTVAAPLLAAAATLRTLAHVQSPAQWHLAPGIWLSKLAWCLGAAQALSARPPHRHARTH